MRVMFDTNVYNRMLNEPAIHVPIEKAAHSGHIKIVETHIQVDELANTPEEERRALLLNVLRGTNATRADTAGFAWDVSRWDQSSWADEALFAFIDSILGTTKRGKTRHLNDALLVATAVREAEVFVTEDGPLLNRARKAVAAGNLPLRILSTGAFVDEIANDTHG